MDENVRNKLINTENIDDWNRMFPLGRNERYGRPFEFSDIEYIQTIIDDFCYLKEALRALEYQRFYIAEDDYRERKQKIMKYWEAIDD